MNKMYKGLSLRKKDFSLSEKGKSKRKFVKNALIVSGVLSLSGGLTWLISEYLVPKSQEKYDPKRVEVGELEYMVFPHLEIAFRMVPEGAVFRKGWESAIRQSVGHPLNPETSKIDLVSAVREYNKKYYGIESVRMDINLYLPKEITAQESIKLFGK